MDLPSNAVSTKETFWFAGPHTVHAGVISVLHARRSGCSPFVSKSRVLCRIHVPSHIPTGNLLSRPGGRKSSTFSANKRVPSGSRRAKRTVQLQTFGTEIISAPAGAPSPHSCTIPFALQKALHPTCSFQATFNTIAHQHLGSSYHRNPAETNQSHD